MRSDFFSFWVKIIIAAMIAATLVNDGGSVIMTYYRIGDETQRVAEEALRNYKLFSHSQEQALRAAQIKAEQSGAVLTGFQITQTAVRVSIEIPSKTTWVAHRIESLKPYLSARGQVDLPLNAGL
ncbi:MAG: hypothetical protein Q8L35_09055 [Actinomycetota bacterium]|nr:hypothetical protein [Actinomycetota bacterium]